MNQMSLFPTDSVSSFRKADPPTLGPAFDQRPTMPIFNQPGSMALMFDTSKLTLADYQNMRLHPQVHASLSLISFMIHQADWSIQCEDKKIASKVEENMRLIWTQLVRGISTAYWAGYAPNVLEWENTPDLKNIFVTKVKDLDPLECSVHWKEVKSNYRPRPEDLVGRNFDPNSIPKVKIFDGIDKFGLQYPIPPEHSFWYPVMMERGDYTGRKLLEPAFMPWYFSILVHLYANRYFERFGEPVPIGRAPLEQTFTFPNPVDPTKTITMSGKQVMEQVMNSLQSSGRVVLPSDRDESASTGSEYIWDIDYLESQMRGVDFERHLARLDEEISLAIFTPMLLMRSGDRGSLNLGVQHTQTWLWSLNALMDDLKLYIDKYLVERIKAYNFTPNAPRCQWMPRKMGKDNTETLRAIINQMISGGRVKPDIEELGTALGMTLHEVRQVAPDPQPALDTRNRAERDRSGDGPRTAGNDLPDTTSQ